MVLLHWLVSPDAEYTMTDQRKCIVVAPMHNEQSNVESFVNRLSDTACDGWELIAVDDGSQDETVSRLRETACHTSPNRLRIRLVSLSRNFGHQRALIAGLHVALRRADELGVDRIAVIDADLQDRPEHLADLLKASSGIDVAYAVRASRGESFLFQIAATTFYRMLARWAKSPVPENAGTFSVMSTRAVRTILENVDENVFFPGLRSWVGYEQVAVPLDRDGRVAGQSRVGIKGLVRLAVGALFGYSRLPLKLMVFISTGSLMLSIIAVIAMTALKLAGLVAVEGIALVVVLIFFNLSVLAIFLTILAYMVGRNPSPVQARQLFVIGGETCLN